MPKILCDEQRQFSELLLKAAGDYGALSAAAADIQWNQNFKEPPSIWGVLILLLPSTPLSSFLVECLSRYLLNSCSTLSLLYLQDLQWR